MILVFPNGLGKGGDSDPVWEGIGRGDDSKADIAFVESLVDQIARTHAVALTTSPLRAEVIELTESLRTTFLPELDVSRAAPWRRRAPRQQRSLRR